MRAALLAASLLTTLGCSSATGLARCEPGAGTAVVCARLDEEFDLRLNETAYIANTPLSIQAVAVPEDSRCPTDVVCAWAGNARVSLTLREGANAEGGDVNSTLQPRAVSRFGYSVELVDVRPARLSTQPLPAEAYVFRLVARRASS
ncbi:MAG TPA: hypothetical protein VJ802_10845 [Gemmatimonadaceae bacterium]|nr:hypothetical protein [Gemmatimonadaceae bacterium]